LVGIAVKAADPVSFVVGCIPGAIAGARDERREKALIIGAGATLITAASYGLAVAAGHSARFDWLAAFLAEVLQIGLVAWVVSWIR
jgi:hypothetical protein